jgi:bifunctional enzyme CysN/CysC
VLAFSVGTFVCRRSITAATSGGSASADREDCGLSISRGTREVGDDALSRPVLNFVQRSSHVGKTSRTLLHGHGPCVVWFTGLSAAGKTTIATRLEVVLRDNGVHTYLLDGDDLRVGLNRDLDFTDTGRVENVRRVGEVARMMVDAGLIVLASIISPFRSGRELARSLVGDDEFCEVFVDTPLEVAEQRDPKGLYRKARAGLLPNFTGVDSPYEPPEDPEVRIDTVTTDPDVASMVILDKLRSMGVVRF